MSERPLMAEEPRAVLAAKVEQCAGWLRSADPKAAESLMESAEELRADRRCGNCRHDRPRVQCERAILRPTEGSGRRDAAFFCNRYEPVR